MPPLLSPSLLPLAPAPPSASPSQLLPFASALKVKHWLQRHRFLREQCPCYRQLHRCWQHAIAIITAVGRTASATHAVGAVATIAAAVAVIAVDTASSASTLTRIARPPLLQPLPSAPASCHRCRRRSCISQPTAFSAVAFAPVLEPCSTLISATTAAVATAAFRVPPSLPCPSLPSWSTLPCCRQCLCVS